MWELVDGRIVEWDGPSRRHGLLESELTRVVGNFVREHHLGSIASGEVLVRILGSRHDARGSDIEFTRRGRLSQEDLDAPAALTVPDLVVEVISPSDRSNRVLDKVRDWLRAGVRLVWYVNPETGTTAVYHGEHVRYIEADELQEGGDVLPGFHVRRRALLEAIAADLADEAD